MEHTSPFRLGYSPYGESMLRIFMFLRRNIQALFMGPFMLSRKTRNPRHPANSPGLGTGMRNVLPLSTYSSFADVRNHLAEELALPDGDGPQFPPLLSPKIALAQHHPN